MMALGPNDGEMVKLVEGKWLPRGVGTKVEVVGVVVSVEAKLRDWSSLCA